MKKIAFIVVIFCSMLYCDHAYASWLSDFGYRQKITLSPSTVSVTGYQIPITVHSGLGVSSAGDIYLNSHLVDTNNFSDIRFTTADGVSLKNYFLQSTTTEGGGVRGVFYLNLDADAATTTDYYMYYGKSATTTQSSFDNTFTKDFGESGLIGLWHMDEQVLGQELIQNGGFENWTGTNPNSWLTEGTSTGIRDVLQDTSVVNSGSNSVKIIAKSSNGTYFGIYQDITTENNAYYQLVLQVRFASTTLALPEFQVFDVTHSSLIKFQAIGTTATTSVYRTVNIGFVSTNTTNIRIKIGMFNETTSGAMYVDDVSLVKSSNLLIDSGPNGLNATTTGVSRTSTDGGYWGSVNQQFSTGGALNFDGKDDYINLGNSGGVDVAGSFTFVAWVKPMHNCGVTGNTCVIVSKQTQVSNPNDGFYMYTNGTTLYTAVFQLDRTRIVQSLSGLNYNQWNMIAGIYDSTNLKISVYLNGATSTAFSLTGFSPAHFQNLILGTYSYNLGSGTYDGLMDDVRFYNRALLKDELNREYNRSKYSSYSISWVSVSNEQLYAESISTNQVSGYTDTSGTLNGILTGIGPDSSVNVYFRYGTDPDDLSHTSQVQQMNSLGSFSINVSGLNPNTKYYYEAVVNGTSNATGTMMSFRTAYLKTDYYYVAINDNGTLNFCDLNNGAIILDSSPKFSFNYGLSSSTDITLSNNSFESATNGTPDGWSVYPSYIVSQSSEYSSDGLNSLKIHATSSSQQYNISAYSPLVQVNQFTDYVISFDTYLSSYSAGSPELYLKYYTTSDGSGTENRWYTPWPISASQAIVGSWHNTKIHWRAPHGVKSIKLWFYTQNSSVMNYYIDNIHISYANNINTTNSNTVDTVVNLIGDSVTISSVDENSATTTVRNLYELNVHSPYIGYTSTLTYKKEAYPVEERFDFLIPSQNVSIMNRDFRFRSIDTDYNYYFDLYSPKVLRFSNGLSFINNDTMQSMLVSPTSTNTLVSYYSDSSNDHPFERVVKNGYGTSVDMSATHRLPGESYSAFVRFSISPQIIKTLTKSRLPYGYDAVALFTNHADSETYSTINAVAYGTDNTASSTYGTKGIVGRGLGWTKSVFVSGAYANYDDLTGTRFKSLHDKLYQDGVEIIGHSITPTTDSRSVVDAGMNILSQYGARNWIDHGAENGLANFEDLHSQGTVSSDSNYILDLFTQYGYQYAWSYNDFATLSSNHDLNMMSMYDPSMNTTFFYNNNNVNDNSTSSKIYLWSTINTDKVPELYYTPSNIDSLISERGIHIGHEYMGYTTSSGHAWYVSSTGSTDIYPAFDSDLAYMQSKVQSGQLWSPTMSVLGDYLSKLQYVNVINNDDGSYTVTNNGSTTITGLTLLAENSVASVLFDNKALGSFGGNQAGHDVNIILPPLKSGQSSNISITYGTKNQLALLASSTDQPAQKVFNITGIYDTNLKHYTMTAEGKGSHTFSITVPQFANKKVSIVDQYDNSDIGIFTADQDGTIQFTATLGSLHTFDVSEYITISVPESTRVQSSSGITYGSRMRNIMSTGSTVASTLSLGSIFTRELHQGMTGSDIRLLQIFLNANGFTVSQSGPGSVGKETTFFGQGTREALRRYQEKHSRYILVPIGYKRGTGILGPSTMKYINSILKITI